RARRGRPAGGGGGSLQPASGRRGGSAGAARRRLLGPAAQDAGMNMSSEPDLTDLRQARLVELVDAITAALRDVVETHGVTEEEWSAVLRFLTEVGVNDEFVLLSDVLRLSVL